MFRPKKIAQMTTPIKIQVANSSFTLGRKEKTYEDVSDNSMCNWSSYNGTETSVNGIINIEETATLTTWFDENIKDDGRIKRLNDNAIFEILNVENIEMRNQFMIVKVRRIKGDV